VRSGAKREFSALASATIGSFSQAVATEPRSALFGHGLATACSLEIFAGAPRGKRRVAISRRPLFDGWSNRDHAVPARAGKCLGTAHLRHS
jgi:hypothetical protein